MEDAQDCAQDAVAGLLAQSEVRHPKAWVATVAYHRYVDVCRLRDRESAAGLVPAPDPRPPGLPGPEDEVLDRIHARWLVRAMERWPASTRAVCVGVASGWPRLRIVSQLGITDRAVESHLTRARRLLRSLSLLGAAVAFALGMVRRLTPVGKPAAGVLVPSLAFTLAVGGGALWHGGTIPADEPATGTVPTVVRQPLVDGPGGRLGPGGGGLPAADAGPTAPEAAVVPGALGPLDRPQLPLVPDLLAVPAVPDAPIAPPALPVVPAAPPAPAVLPVPPLPSVPPVPPVLPVPVPPPL